MSHTTPTASLAIRLFDNGHIEIEHKGDLSALLRYLDDALKAEVRAKAEQEAMPC